jgi:hypothetical protein
MKQYPVKTGEFVLAYDRYAKLRNAILALMEEESVPFILFDHLAKAISSDLEAAYVFGAEKPATPNQGESSGVVL